MEQEAYRHGFDPGSWEAAKDEARAVLYDVARKRRTISYSSLVEHIKSIRMEPHDPRLAHFLGQIAREDDDAGHGLTTVVVVHKTGDMQPGGGFFEMAASRGREIAEADKFWIDELNRVYAHWAA
jgi:hypothetical protein